mmetsp:Transcript_39138/g.65767  ORF Transcript_39138/g.65767 Transcript_39138/m.65767 type:complete len:145 (+) Transcript_39138:3-437(+)
MMSPSPSSMMMMSPSPSAMMMMMSPAGRPGTLLAPPLNMTPGRPPGLGTAIRIGGGQLAMGESNKLRTLPRGSNNHAIASPQMAKQSWRERRGVYCTAQITQQMQQMTHSALAALNHSPMAGNHSPMAGNQTPMVELRPFGKIS